MILETEINTDDLVHEIISQLKDKNKILDFIKYIAEEVDEEEFTTNAYEFFKNLSEKYMKHNPMRKNVMFLGGPFTEKSIFMEYNVKYLTLRTKKEGVWEDHKYKITGEYAMLEMGAK